MLLSKASKQDQDKNLHFELIFIVEIWVCYASIKISGLKFSH